MFVLENRTLESVLRARIHIVINLKLMEQLRHGKYMFFSQCWMKILCIMKVSDGLGPQKVYSEGK